MQQRIVLTGGGTGGHLIPTIALWQELRRRHADAEFLYVGSKAPLEKNILHGYPDLPQRTIATGKVRRYFSLRNVVDMVRVAVGTVQSFFILRTFAPTVVVSKGGYVSVPVVLAAALLRIPIVAHESDTTPGLANRIALRYARVVCTSFVETAKTVRARKGQTVVATGPIVRSDIAQGKAERAQEYFHLASGKPVVLVLGGSSGAHQINELLIPVVQQLMQRASVVHQTGDISYDRVVQQAGGVFSDLQPIAGGTGMERADGSYTVVPFIHEGLADILARADVVVSRAGANALAELALCGKAAVLVPLPAGAQSRGDQLENAAVFAKANAAVVLDTATVTSADLLSAITGLLDDSGRREQLSANIRKLSVPGGLDNMVAAIEQLFVQP